MRTGVFTMNLLYGLDGYDNHFSFYYQTPELLILLPTTFFLNIWTPIRLKYRAGKWFWISLGIYVFGTIILGFSSPIDQTILNGKWTKSNAPYNKIVDDEIKRALINNITISEKTIETLKFNKKQRVTDLAKLLRMRFTDEKSISTDSIVIELILVKKSTIRFIDAMDRNNFDSIWPFALPRDVYYQILKSRDSVRTQYLKDILTEYKEIFKKSEKEPWELGEGDGLYEKYQNRLSMQRWYKNIGKESEEYYKKIKDK
jgi:hypothetical protein